MYCTKTTNQKNKIPSGQASQPLSKARIAKPVMHGNRSCIRAFILYLQLSLLSIASPCFLSEEYFLYSQWTSDEFSPVCVQFLSISPNFGTDKTAMICPGVDTEQPGECLKHCKLLLQKALVRSSAQRFCLPDGLSLEKKEQEGGVMFNLLRKHIFLCRWNQGQVEIPVFRLDQPNQGFF